MTLVDLASRDLGGSVVFANDELFAQRENLILPHPPRFDAHSFGHKGKVYDGWETRRRRDDRRDTDPDFAVVRLGAAGVVHEVVVDTAHFTGNYPPQVSVEATSVEGYPSVEELLAGPWEPVLARSPARGDTANTYAVSDPRRWTHVRLSIWPDGGVARFRVRGVAVPDPRFLTGTVDLLAAENGGRLVGCSDAFYSSPANLALPGRAQHMGEGWENARRRGGGNDFAVYALAAPGVLTQVEVDTSYFVGNAAGEVRLSTADSRVADLSDVTRDAVWTEVLDRRRVQPDTRHRYLVPSAPEATHARLDVYPDGGLSRLRLWGAVTPSGLAEVRRRWWEALPSWHREQLPAEAPGA